MNTNALPLMEVYSGWDGYHRSLVSAVAPLSREHLLYRIAAGRRSVGEIAAHIAFGRIGWFDRMDARASKELVAQAEGCWQRWSDAASSVTEDAAEIVRWLEAGWQRIETCLRHWTVADLQETYLQQYSGNTYAVSRQWTMWRVMAHDIHHGGQLSVLLAAQGIELPELGDNGGHIVEPPLADAA